MSTAQANESPLTPYVPRLLIEWESEAAETSFRELEGTLVFVDISGFTRMSERLSRKGKVGAEEVTEVLNSSFSRLLALAWEDGGGLLKFGGDALLLFFSGSGHSLRACHAAVEMRRTLRESSRLKTSAGVISLRMSVGIHSGGFQFFLAGDSHRELIVTGPAASQTVAMESAADAGDILLSPSTAAALGESLLGAVKGKGRLLKEAPTIPAAKAPGRLPRTRLELATFVPVAMRSRVAAGLEEGEHRQVTVGFLRFTGTDALLSAAGCVEVQARLDGLIRGVQRAACEYEICLLGTDIDRDGGKIILTAGAPESSGNDEERMLRALRAVADGHYGLGLQVGVNRGHVFAGDVGAAFRRTYTVMGDAVNLAARLMQRAEPGQILATAEVIRHSPTLFETEALEPFLVKGRARPVVAYSVGAIRGSRERYAGGGLPLVGREQEMQSLLSALESVRRGDGCLVQLVGEAGIGKSRLIDELKTKCSDMTYVATACEQYESSTPYVAFRGLLRSLVGIRPDEDARRAGERLRRRVHAVAPEFDPWLPLLAIPMDVTVAPTRESEELTPEFRKARLHRVVAAFLEKTLRRPAVLVFEDVHWMDEASGELIRHICETASGRPRLVCITKRPQETGFCPGADLPRETIRLEPLGVRASTALATAAAEEMLLPQHQVAALARRAGGNPLFLQELVAASGVGVQEGVEALPDSVEAVITTRIDKLAPRARALMRYAAVIGPSFSLDLLDRVLGSDVPDVGDAATWERLGEFLDQEQPGAFRFRHALFRDAAYEGLPYRRRRDLHQRVGRELERQHPQTPEEQAELLSLHFHRAQDFQKSWGYSLVAGDRARTKFANVEAARFYRRALEAARHLQGVKPAELARVSEALGDVCELAALYADSARAYRSAHRFAADDPTSQPRLLLKEGVIRERSGRYTQALRWYGRGLRCLAGAPPGESQRASRVQLELAYAGVRFRQGRYSECIRWCQEVLGDAEAIGDKAGLAHAYYLLAHAYTFLGSSESKRYRALALPIYEELGDLVGQANVLNNLGIEAYFEGNWKEALALYQRSKDARERAGDIVGAATATNNIGEILSDQGRLAQAEALFGEALRVWRAARYPVGVALATSNLGRAAARGGRLEEADGLLDEALRLFREIGAQSFVLETEARIAERHIFGGDSATALRLASSTLQRATEKGGMAVLLAMLHRLCGYAQLRAEEPDPAERHLQESLRLGRSVSAGYEVALTLEALARLARITGRGPPDDYAAEGIAILNRLGVASTPPIPLPGQWRLDSALPGTDAGLLAGEEEKYMWMAARGPANGETRKPHPRP